MTRLYRKNELTFALVWIALYVVLLSIADSLSADLGTQKIITAPLCILMSGVIFVWTRQNGLCEKYGLQKPQADGKRYLYFLPLAVIASSSLWFGFGMGLSAAEAALRVVSMLCVGFLEEIIFRGFLMKAIYPINARRAVIISSVTFGLGHIVNLLNGAPLSSTLLQIVYAVALGFLFTIIFLKTKSLIPCIATHSAINSLSTFAREQTDGQLIAITVALAAISLLYAAYILRANPEKG